jgi:hypothetical protein
MYQRVILMASALCLLGITGCSSVPPTATSSNAAGSIDNIGLASYSTHPDANDAKVDINGLRIGPDRYNTESRDFEYPWPFGPEGGAQ